MSTFKSTLSPGLAAEYDSTKTYEVGEYVLWQNAYWKCTTAIAVAESWTQAHWERDEKVLEHKADLVEGKIPAGQIPEDFNDVLEFADRDAFPPTGTVGILYVAKDTGKVYRWSSDQAQYVEVGNPAQIQSDWSQTNTSSKDYIKNKPDVATKDDATLNEVSNEWTFVPATFEYAGETYQWSDYAPHYKPEEFEYEGVTYNPGWYGPRPDMENGPYSWSGDGPDTLTVSTYYDSDRVVATRASAYGFRLGPATSPNRNKLLASESEAEALRTAVAGKMPSTATGADIAVSGTDPTKISAALAGKASKADATLTELGDPQTPGFSEWQYGELTYSDPGGDDWFWTFEYPAYSLGTWTTEITNGPVFITMTATGDEDATSLSFASASGSSVTASGTISRTALPGYQLGNDDQHILASEAEAEALRAGKANKSEMAITAVPGDDTKKNVQLKSGTAQDVVVDHQQLADMYGDDPTAAKWVCSPASMSGYATPYKVAWKQVGEDAYAWVLSGGDGSQVNPYEPGDPSAGTLSFEVASYGMGQTEVQFVTATRVPVSYQLGTQSGRKLATAEQGAKADNALPAADVVAPSTSSSASGKAADAKATGDVLAQKADRASNPTAGNLAALNAQGNPTDSGRTSADFMAADAKVRKLWAAADANTLDGAGAIRACSQVASKWMSKDQSPGDYPLASVSGTLWTWRRSNVSYPRITYDTDTGNLIWYRSSQWDEYDRQSAPGQDPASPSCVFPQLKSTYYNTTADFTAAAESIEDADPTDFLARVSDLAAFSTTKSYAVGDIAGYDGKVYRCTTAHTGAWNASHFTLATKAEVQAYLAGIVASIDGKQDALTSQQLANIAAVPGKASRAANPTSGNFAALDSQGNPTDSGKKPADFATAAQGQKADDSVQRVPDNANPSAKTAVTIGTRSTEDAADRGQASLAVGDHPKASGKNAVATGTWTQATGQDAHAEGNMSQATNYGAHAEGDNTRATGAYSHAEGTDTEASGLVAHAEGNYTTAAGTGAHSEGMFAKASGVAAHAEGSNLDKLADLLEAAGADQQIVALFRRAATDAAGSFSHTEGLVSATSEMGSHAQGFRASDGGNQFSFVWQGYSGAVPTSEQMQALLNDPKSQDAQAALQCLVTALNARAAYASKGSGTFCINPVSQGGSTDPKSGFFIGDESLDKALRYSFHTATVSSGATPAVTNLADRAINTVTLGSSVTTATVTLPTATAGYARDFFIDLTIEATSAPTITFTDPATSTIATIAFGADSLADVDPGANLMHFTELPNNRWLASVKHEEAAA